MSLSLKIWDCRLIFWGSKFTFVSKNSPLRNWIKTFQKIKTPYNFWIIEKECFPLFFFPAAILIKKGVLECNTGNSKEKLLICSSQHKFSNAKFICFVLQIWWLTSHLSSYFNYFLYKLLVVSWIILFLFTCHQNFHFWDLWRIHWIFHRKCEITNPFSYFSIFSKWTKFTFLA